MQQMAQIAVVIVTVALVSSSVAGEAAKETTPLQAALANTKPLEHPQGDRPPLVLWTPDLPATAGDAELEQVIKDLKARGIGLLHRWGGDADEASAAGIRIGKLQRKLGMPVLVDGTGLAHGFFTGDEKMGHVDADGKHFRDTSFFWSPGCPFTLEERFAEKRKAFADYARRYRQAGVAIDYWMGDFEFDGPNEWNDGWAAAKKCTVCREKIPNIDTDFAAFQKAVRDIRTRMQREAWVEPLRAAFPAIRIGNYGMNPHDGFRYWSDFYENPSTDLPHKMDGKAIYRPWADEFKGSGYTIAMPVIYTWFRIWDSYTFENKQYRWFSNMLREASSVGRSKSAGLPVIAFVHWSTTNPPKELPAGFEPMSEATYEELLWHMLLRGTTGFAMWSPPNETAVEVQPVHRVYAASLQYADFLSKGVPQVFDVPEQPGTVVSAVRLGRKLLARRTDFAESDKPVEIKVDGKSVVIPPKAKECLVLDLPR